MSEKHIREVLREVCEELDRCARKVVFPTLLGAGLALSAGACGDGRPTPTDQTVARPDAAYGSPFRDRGADVKRNWENPPQPPYMAPPDGGIGPLYAAPMDLGKKKLDGPPLPPYMAPDVGPKPKLDGPKPKLDGGIAPLYMPAFPDAK